MATIKDHVFAKLVVNSRFATKSQVMECMEARNLMTSPGKGAPKLWDVLIQKGYLTQEQLSSILEGFQEKQKRLFGEIALKWNMVTRPQLDEAVQLQESMRSKGQKAPRIGQILTSKNYLKKHQVMAILEEQNKKIAKCPACKAQFNVRRVQQGQKFKCTQCGKVLKILDDKASLDELDAHATMVKQVEPEFKGKKEKAKSQIGEYRIEKKLGEDSTGLIYKAKGDKDEKPIALKVLSQDAAEDKKFVKDLTENVKKVLSFDHPNIKKIYSIGKADSSLYIATEFVEGESLRNILNRDGKVGVRKSLKIATQVARALQYAHEKGVMHGDIRPSNILISTKGDVILSNLGLSTKITDNILTIVDSGQLAPFYIAPETVLEDRETDFRADIYSLGATLYHLIAGRPPFEGQSPFEVLMRFTEDFLPPIQVYNPETPEGVVKVIEKMVAAEPDERYKSYEDLIHDLEDPTRILAGKAPVVPPALAEAKEDTRLDELAKPGGGLLQKPGVVVGIAAAALLVVGGIFFLLFREGGVAGGSSKDDYQAFKKYYVAHQKLDELDEVIRRAEELKKKYPDDKDLRDDLDRKIEEAKQKRNDQLRKEAEQVKKRVNVERGKGDYAAGYAIFEEERAKHSLSAWHDELNAAQAEFEGHIRSKFDQRVRAALVDIRDSRRQPTAADYDKAIAEMERIAAEFGSVPQLQDYKKKAETELSTLVREKEELVARMGTRRQKASDDLLQATLAEANQCCKALKYDQATKSIQNALKQTDGAEPVLLPEARAQVEDLGRRCEALMRFMIRFLTNVKAEAGRSGTPIGPESPVYVHLKGGREGTIRSANKPEDIRVRIEKTDQKVHVQDILPADLLRVAIATEERLDGDTAANLEIGWFALHMGDEAVDESERRTFRFIALDLLSRARSIDPSIELPRAYPEIEAEVLAVVDAAIEDASARSGEGKWQDAIRAGLEVAGTHFSVARIYELRYERVRDLIVESLSALHGPMDGATLLTFEDASSLEGWTEAPEHVNVRPDGGFARLGPKRFHTEFAERTQPAPFQRVVFFFRLGTGTNRVSIAVYDADKKKIPISLEPERVSLNYKGTKSGEVKFEPGRWHVLEFFREGAALRLSIDFGTVELATEVQGDLVPGPLTILEIKNDSNAKEGEEAAASFDLDNLLLR
ncbi:MAG: protein kinase [Planctomycetes bacterium]|nr:protein kinase [Planctomycetota bacterium]